MSKVNIEEGNAALERVLLMMNYDLSKTLKENKVVISEQEPPKGFRNIVVSYQNPGTDEIKMVKGFKELSKVEDFITLNNYFKKNFRGNDLQQVLNSELGSDDAQYAKEIQDHLKSIGITMTFMTSPDKKGVVDNTIKIEIPTGQTPEKTSFGCLSKIAKYKIRPGKYRMGKGVYFFDKYGRYTYTPDGGKSISGSWKCDSAGFIEMDGKRAFSSTTQFIQAPTEEEVKAGTKVLKIGMKGDLVTKIQEQLKVRGVDPKGVDGKFGKNTKNAVIEYQNKVGLKPDGVVGKSTYERLFLEPSIQNQPTQDTVDIADKGIKNVFTPTTPEIGKAPQMAPALTPKQQRQANKLADHVEPSSTIKESMKTNLKKTLLEKKQEKSNLLIESKIINNRFAILGEGRVIKSVDDQVRLVEDIIVEMNYMVSQGYTSQVINEGLFSFLGGLFGDSLKSVPAVFGEYIASWLTKTLGIPEGSFMQSAIVALVGNLNMADYDKFFTDCRFASNKIADSLIEGYLLQMQQKSQSTSQGASGFITSALRNAVSDYFLEQKDGIIQKLQDMIGDFICPKLGKVTSTISDVAKDIKDKVVS
jgi:hypothetical protein